MIKLTKIGINPASLVQQAQSVEEYRADQERGGWGQFFEGKSPPIEYTITGEPLRPPQVGEPFVVDRRSRNGIAKSGILRTSRVEAIREGVDFTLILTANSVYTIETT